MVLCARCNEEVIEEVVCSSCSSSLHYPCAGISENGYRKLGDRKTTWRCMKCKSDKHMVRKPVSTPPSPTSAIDLDVVWAKMIDISAAMETVKSIADDVRIIKSDIAEIKTSTDLLFTKISSLEERVTKIENLKDETKAYESRLRKLEVDLAVMDQWLRANNVEIKGVPQKSNENLYDIVNTLGKKITYNISKSQINYITRIPSREKSSPKPIIVSFINRYAKEDFIAAAKMEKNILPTDLGLVGSQKIFVNDHLTTQRKILLSKAKSKAKENNFQFVWVKHSKIFARKSTLSPVLAINTDTDLEKIH